jgi:ADP-heptose:LPS heptosyltransferase
MTTNTARTNRSLRIAILKPCCIGDVVMTTPLLCAIHRAYPDAAIDWLVGSWSADAIKDHPQLNRVIDLGPTANPARTVSGLWRLVRTLRAGHYNQLYVPDRSVWLSLAAGLSGIPVRIGLDSGGRGLGYNRRAPINPDEVRHESEIYLDLARRMSLNIDGCWENIVPSDASRAEVNHLLGDRAPQALALDRPLVLVHPGGGMNPGMTFISKRWPVERITELCQQLASSVNGIIIILGSVSDSESAKKISALLPPETLQYNLCGVLNLPQLAALAAQPNVVLYIGNDTGTAHLAAAAGARTLMVFGPSDPRRYAPFVSPSQGAVAWRPVVVPERGVAGGGMANFDWARDGVTVAEAWAQAKSLLNSQPKDGLRMGEQPNAN